MLDSLGKRPGVGIWFRREEIELAFTPPIHFGGGNADRVRCMRRTPRVVLCRR